MRRYPLGLGSAVTLSFLLFGCPAAKKHDSGAGNDGGSSTVAGKGGGGGGTAGGAGKHDAGGGTPVMDGGAANADAAAGGCVRGGCSGQACSEASAPPVITTCEYRAEYGCYQKAACERQASGKCGFTPSQALSDCLANPSLDAGAPTGLSWYETCGGPLCRATPVDDPNVPNCATQKAGASCTTEGTKCDLVDACGTMLLCTNTDPTQPGCPRSRARFKQGISYLSAEQRERIYHDLLGIPLASYAYKDDAQATPQLGFILEDVEPSPAARGDHVNLYGYLSMAVAAVQVQAKEIEALKREVRALRAQVGHAPKR